MLRDPDLEIVGVPGVVALVGTAQDVGPKCQR
jgi:hypothetical protein